MPPLNHFQLLELQASPTGQVWLRALATGLRQGQAVGMAQRALPGEPVLVVGSPNTRSTVVTLPARVQDLRLGDPKALANRVDQWFGWLRAHGVLRLRELEVDGIGQPVPARWLRDPLVCACLGIVLSPTPDGGPDQVPGDDEWLALAPRHSVAGLLRDAKLSGALRQWLEYLPGPHREPLQVPLFHMHEDLAGPLRIGWWSLRHRGHAFMLGEATWLRVDSTGWIEPALRPIDRAGEPWPLAQFAGLREPDVSFRLRLNPMLDRLFHRLPAAAEHCLAVAAHDAKRAGIDAETADADRQLLTQHLAGLLPAKFTSMTSRLLQRAWPVGGAAPTLRRSRYLHAEGDPLRRQRRLQLGEMAPALALHIADGLCPTASTAVDMARPLLAPLATDWKVPVWAARRTVALLREVPSLKGTGVDDAEELAQCITALGPHAPELAPADLPLIAELRDLVPVEFEGPHGFATLRAGGREAAVSGWDGVRAVLQPFEDGDGPYELLFWWDTMRANVADVLARHHGRDACDAAAVDSVLAMWLRDTTLSDSLRLARRWQAMFMGHDARLFAVDDIKAPSLFGELTLPGARIEVQPLTCWKDLQNESRQMRNCIASFHITVMTGEVLVASLRCPATEARVTAAFGISPEGVWKVSEASGPGNRPIAPDGAMPAALSELVALLNDETQLDAGALAFYRAPRSRSTVLRDFAINGQCLTRRLPREMARLAERQFPGQGSLERRILHAASRVAPLSEQAL